MHRKIDARSSRDFLEMGTTIHIVVILSMRCVFFYAIFNDLQQRKIPVG
jgi:hypothetical protein